MPIERSDTIKELATALSAFHLSVAKIPKDETNPFYNKRYASLSGILDAIKQPLQDAGLVFTQFPTGQNGLATVLIHYKSGEFMQCEYFIQPVKNDPQSQGSALTYMRRYSLSAILGLNIDDDDDANAASTPPKKPAQLPTISDKQLMQFLGKLETAKDMNEVDTLLKNVKANFSMNAAQNNQITAKVGIVSKKFNGSTEANK